MLRDEKAGALVNLLPSDKPKDIYQLVANSVTDKLKEHVKEGKPYAQQWLDYGVKRSTTKRSIMTICYGSTRFSCTDIVVEDLNVNFYSQIRGQAKYLLDSAKNLQRAIKNQNDMTTIEEIEYIHTKSKLMLEMAKDKKYQQ